MSIELVTHLRQAIYSVQAADAHKAADLIERQEARIAKLEQCNAKIGCTNYGLRRQLALAQADNQRLREAVIQMRDNAEEYGQAWARAYVKEYQELLPGSAKEQFDLLGVMQDRMDKVGEALSTPLDTSTIEAIVQKAGEVMRERCTKFVLRNMYSNQSDADAIRALPCVTLEDLK